MSPTEAEPYRKVGTIVGTAYAARRCPAIKGGRYVSGKVSPDRPHTD
jgi:hypothetical protein